MSNETKRGALGCRNAMQSKRTILCVICAVATAGLAIGVAVERHAWFQLNQEDRALQQQLSPRDKLIAENQRLSNLVVQVKGSPSRPNQRSEAPSATDERVKELVRLRREVEGLRQQSNEIETLRQDTRQVRAARENGLKTQNAGQAATANNGLAANGSQLEVLKAEYWTANTNLDVTEALSGRIRGDGLKAIASNNLKGDPEYGQVKHLTVVYRSGGVTRTNEFREGDLVILPGE
jgi:hypothetical protein